MKAILVSALSLDGKIGRDSADRLDWVSSENKGFFGRVSREAGAVVFGHKTFKAIKKPLKERLVVVLTSRPEEKESTPGRVEFTDQEPEEILANLEKRGFEKVIVGGGQEINRLFLGKDLVDEIWLVIEPVVLGGGLDLFSLEDSETRFKLLAMEKINHSLAVLKYGRR